MEKLRSRILSKWVLPVVAVGVLGLASAPSVHGIPTLSISDGLGHTLNLSNASGGITYTGTLGNFTLNISSGVATGDALLPGLNFSATGTGILTILFSNTSFGTLGGSISSQISGQTSGTTVSATLADAGNRLFGNSTVLSTGGPFTGGAFSGTASATFPVPGPFSLTEKIVIVQSVFGTTSFGTTVNDPAVVAPAPVVTVPDAGATAPLLGLALLGIGLARRKLKAL
jgi:hypothetical protein